MHAARPTPMSIEDMGRIEATKRHWYEVKVIDVQQAAMALHARAVLLISNRCWPSYRRRATGAGRPRDRSRIRVGEYDGARWGARQARLKELELLRDAMAAVMLDDLGLEPSGLIDGIAKISRFNRDRFGAADNEAVYPTVAERRACAREVQRWLRDGR
jgi:hypothetical protein